MRTMTSSSMFRIRTIAVVIAAAMMAGGCSKSDMYGTYSSGSKSALNI